MRRNSLLIDLAGVYWPTKNRTAQFYAAHLLAEDVSRNFGVFCRHVYLSGLYKHYLDGYEISDGEIDQTVKVVNEYVKNR